MSYQVLARKWRPRRFAELVGQSHVVSAITHALNNDKLHHAYLFTGTRGVGKTTIARIFSKSLNCEQGQTADPCGKCDTCLAIEQGHYVDLLEIDAASRTKVEDTRELLDNVQYKPTRGKYKVYLIDEVHMLSKHSFNALLKTLEEPPEHVKFLLATTDPQKLPITILSRCLQFNLKALSREQIANQLRFILQQESVPSQDNALDLLARAANGSMRDALSLTDQAIAQGNNEVKADVVTNMLGMMDKQVLLKLLNAIVSGEQDKILHFTAAIAEQAPDYALVLSELSSLLHQIALTQWSAEACKLETTSARAIYALAKQIPSEHVQLLYNFALEGKKELPFSVDGRTCLEMTVIRMATFAPKPNKHLGIQEITQGPEPEKASSARVEDSLGMPFENEHYVDSEHDAHALDAHMGQMDDEQHQLEIEKSQAVAPAPNQQSALEKTQALLALREKLSAPEQNKPEGQSSVKKSDTSFPLPKAPAQTQNEENTPPWSLNAASDTPSEETEPFVEKEAATVTAPVKKPESADVKVDLPLQAYLPNGEKLLHAHQIDEWSELIQATDLSGLTKQIALHSEFKRSGNTINLLMEESQQHLLNNEAAISHVEKCLQKALSEPVIVEVECGKPRKTPHSIQASINSMREKHAINVIETDEEINALKVAFDAQVDNATIQPR